MAWSSEKASFTFKVDDVEQATTSLSPAKNWEKLITSRCGVKPESYSKPMSGWTPTYGYGGHNHALLEAINTAYDKHYPLVLSPDAVWLLIAQGFARHVNENAEKLRNLFVEHEGKKMLTVRRDYFTKGSPDNPWPEVFGEFSEQIRKNIGHKLHDLLSPSFSTTGPVEKAAADVVLMDTMKEFFGYRMMTRCGIPEITLEGTLEDWKKLRDRAVALAEFDLEWWITEVTPVLDQFVKAASGKPDQKFWSKMYKQDRRSGGPFLHGWIITFFPYLSKLRNPHLASWRHTDFFGIKTDSFDKGICATPFIWQYLGTDIPMHFYAGFTGAVQHQTSLAIRPQIGWAVCDDKERPRKDAGLAGLF